MIWNFLSAYEAIFHITREALKLHLMKKHFKRFSTEVSLELQLLAEKWKLLLAGIFFQYIHGLAARGVHYLHRPGPILQDTGFRMLPELGRENAYISETVFSFLFFSFVMWTFHPFVFQSKRFYTVLLWRRILVFLVACQSLRIITFYATQLPGPNYHCREGSKLARLPHPDNILEVLLLNFPHGLIFGCGDLIFSSHMIFTLVFVITYQKYGSKRYIKYLAWLIAVLISLLIIASRKHYTVDVVVAWYTVHLVVFFVDKQLGELPDRSAQYHLLPLIAKDREENAKPLNGKSVETVDWRHRPQINGMIENGSHIHTEKAMNGTTTHA